jgi:hypothetical protein
MPNTEAWRPHLKRAAKEFYDEICSINAEYGKIIEYHEKSFDKIFEKYDEYIKELHNIHGDKLLDRHKIIASYILAFTNKDDLLFQTNNDAINNSSIKEFSPCIMYPNELYIANIMLSILSQFALSTKKGKKYNLKDYDIRLPDKVVCWENDFPLPYFDHFIRLLASLIEYGDKNKIFLITGSNLIFFFELAYDCAVAGLSQVYYC